ncbi:hypothetical protein YSY22_13730 [Brevibacillus formosus]
MTAYDVREFGAREEKNIENTHRPKRRYDVEDRQKIRRRLQRTVTP